MDSNPEMVFSTGVYSKIPTSLIIELLTLSVFLSKSIQNTYIVEI